MQGNIPAKNLMTMDIVLHLWTILCKKLSCGFENFKNAPNFQGAKPKMSAEISAPIFSKIFLGLFWLCKAYWVTLINSAG